MKRSISILIILFSIISCQNEESTQEVKKVVESSPKINQYDQSKTKQNDLEFLEHLYTDFQVDQLDFKFRSILKLFDAIHIRNMVIPESFSDKSKQMHKWFEEFKSNFKSVEMNPQHASVIFSENKGFSPLRETGTISFPYITDLKCLGSDFRNIYRKSFSQFNFIVGNWYALSGWIKSLDKAYYSSYLDSIYALNSQKVKMGSEQLKLQKNYLEVVKAIYYPSGDTPAARKKQASEMSKSFRSKLKISDENLERLVKSNLDTLTQCVWKDNRTAMRVVAIEMAKLRAEWILGQIAKRKMHKNEDFYKYIKVDKSNVIQSSARDPWYRFYHFHRTATSIELRSLGADGIESDDDIVVSKNL